MISSLLSTTVPPINNHPGLLGLTLSMETAKKYHIQNALHYQLTMHQCMAGWPQHTSQTNIQRSLDQRSPVPGKDSNQCMAKGQLYLYSLEKFV